MLCLKIAGWVANSVDPDETPHFAASHLGLYCLLRPICPNIYGKYGNVYTKFYQKIPYSLWSSGISMFSYCVPCVAWQTHRDHVVHQHRHQCGWCCRRWCCRHTFRFCSRTLEGMHWFHSKSTEVYIIVRYRSFDIGNRPPNFGRVMALFRLNFCCWLRYWLPFNNFCRNALISLEVCRRIYHCEIHVKLNFGNHQPNFFLSYGPFST